MNIKRLFTLWDLDNCLFDDKWREPLIDHRLTGNEKYAAYNERLGEDKVCHLRHFRLMCDDTRIQPIFMTGRQDRYFLATQDKIQRDLGVWVELGQNIFMRKGDEQTRPADLKRRQLHELRAVLTEVYGPDGWEIVAAFDDLPNIVDMYREEGITACQLAIHPVSHAIYSAEDLQPAAPAKSEVPSGPRRIVGFHGPAGSGKDTCGAVLVDTLGYTKLSFAAPIYKALEAMGFGWPQTQAEKEAAIEWLELRDAGRKARWRDLGQTLGTEWGRNLINPDLWLLVAKHTIEQNPNTSYVFTDVRFENEAAAVREMGGIVVHLRGRREEATANKGHASEQPLAVYPGDYTFFNDQDSLPWLKEQLLAQLRGAL